MNFDTKQPNRNEHCIIANEFYLIIFCASSVDLTYLRKKSTEHFIVLTILSLQIDSVVNNNL